MSKLTFLIVIFLFLFFSTHSKTVTLYSLYSKNIGRKGTLLIEAGPSSNFDRDSTKKILFQTKIISQNNSRTVDCGLLKLIDDRLYAFCNIGTDIPSGNYTISFSNIPSFNYQGQIITLEIFYYPRYDFEKLDKDIISLVSGEQTIDIGRDIDTYELKFSIASYNKETLMLRTQVYIFMDCIQENIELICKIKKDELEKGLYSDNYTTSVYYTDETSDNGISELSQVRQVRIRDIIKEKLNVYVGITRLLENVVEGESQVAYETNVTYINKVATSFDDNSKLRFINEYGNYYDSLCYLRKYDDNPLIIVCKPPNIGKCWLSGVVTWGYIRGNIRYNFIIEPVKNEEKIYHSSGDRGVSIEVLYPETLNFSGTEYLNIYYVPQGSNKLKGITFNKEKGDLDCEIKGSKLVKCRVPKNHFDKNGYYFTKHTNHLDGKSIYYESVPVKVVLKANFYYSSLYYSLLLILILF